MAWVLLIPSHFCYGILANVDTKIRVWYNEYSKIWKGMIVMTHCTQCGAPIEEGAAFCINCGCSLTDATPVMVAPPVAQLKTNRGLLKYILLSLITFGIYGIVVMSTISRDINIIATRYDGKKTMHYCLVCFVFSWLTLGVVPLVWMHRISNRIGTELVRRNYDYDFGASTFWLWGVLGSLILVGPFIYYHKLLKSMNLISESYNYYG